MLHVLIPSKNNAKTLSTQIKIFREVFLSNSNIKIIVLDNSVIQNQYVADICNELDWIYDNSAQALSVSDNFNRGLSYIKNREGYSTFIGDDDFITSDALLICEFLKSRNIDLFRPIFKNLLYWNGFTSRRGTVTCDFEIRENCKLIQSLHQLVKKHIFKDVNKYDGPQFNILPSFYHCIFSNTIVNDFSFGPFAPDSYSSGYLCKKNSTVYYEVSNAIIPGSAPRSASAYTAVKDGYDSFSSHAHTSIYLDDDTLSEVKSLPYRSDYIWYLSFIAGDKKYKKAKQFSQQDLNEMASYTVDIKLKQYKRVLSLVSAATVKIKKYQRCDFIDFLKNGWPS